MSFQSSKRCRNQRGERSGVRRAIALRMIWRSSIDASRTALIYATLIDSSVSRNLSRNDSWQRKERQGSELGLKLLCMMSDERAGDNVCKRWSLLRVPLRIEQAGQY